MEILASKLITLFVLIFLTILFSVLPYFLVLRNSSSLVSARREKVIALLNCFGGGVFLGTLLLHLITEGDNEFSEYKSKAGWKTEFPLFNLFIAGGFFVVAFIEFFMHSHLRHKRDSNVRVRPPEEDPLLEQNSAFESQYGAVGNRNKKREFSSYPKPKKENHAQAEQQEAGGLFQGRYENTNCEHVIGDSNAAGSHSGPDVTEQLIQRQHEHQNCDIISAANNSTTVTSEQMSGAAGVIAELSDDGLRAFLLLFALSFHTIFDGLAVGLQKSNSDVWQVFTAISIHKSVIAFCLGLELFKCHLNTPWRAFAWISFFSLMAPLGIGLGIYLTSGGINELARLLSSSILQGVAAGTFLYVTFLEILVKYIGHNGHTKFLHIFFAMIGFIFMALVKLLDSD